MTPFNNQGRVLIAITLIIFSVGCKPSMPDEVEQAYLKLPEKIDYNFHVKPILSDRCYQCHGPDENSRKANLRLDIEEEAFMKLSSGNKAFVRGSLRKSEAFHRLISTDPEFIMPPPDSKLELSAEEVAIITKWVEQGAEWKQHWSFIPVESPEIPELVKDWDSENPIDRFIQSRIKSVGLTPNPQADKERLLRRVTMDLTGLPPSLEEITDFVNDESKDAYEKVVDRLLKSDENAERLAMEWLDVARYADSHGVSFDGYRNMWPYRDWVIEAFAENMPYDEFITKQVAGDLIENGTDKDKLATAFYRLNPMEASQGSISEEYRVEYVAERTSTTGTAFLGLTIGCARCHDHKFDPISQKEFFQISAFFNSVEELGLGPTDKNRAPTILIMNDEQKEKIQKLEKSIYEKEIELEELEVDTNEVEQLLSRLENQKIIPGEIAYYPFESVKEVRRLKEYWKKQKEKEEKKKKEGKRLTEEEKKKKEEQDKVPEKDKYEEVLIVDGNEKSEAKLGVTTAPGKKGNGLYFDDDYEYAMLEEVGVFDHYDPFSISVWINPLENAIGKVKTIIGNSNNYSGFYRGWDLEMDSLNRVKVRLIHRLPDDFIEISTNKTVPYDSWTQVGFVYDGSRQARGISIFINGEEADSKILSDRLKRSIKPIDAYTIELDTASLRVGKSRRAWTGDVGIFTGTVDEIRIFDRALTHVEMAKLGEIESGTISEKLKQKDAVIISGTYKGIYEDLKKLRIERSSEIDSLEEVMVMEDLKEARTTYLLERGIYNAYGEEVDHGTPQQILEYSEEYPKNRLGLAEWLTNRKNPLTSRVIMNRYWQMIFGLGLVKTTDDFGNQGELPTHPELLDWLAADFMDNGWDLKRMLKTMVMSNTYRQSSMVSPEKLEADPENIFYARSNSYRWPAEMIRDNALAASGLLSDSVGGPSVKPYQPDGLWKELGDFSFTLGEYKEDTLDNLYRRSMYTFIKRFSPPPFMINFDATNREFCITKRVNTNTPLQALNLLNDPQFVEASRVLSERMQKDVDNNLEDQIALGFRLSTGTTPSQEMILMLSEHYNGALKHFEENPNLADSLLSIGDKPFDTDLDKTKTAALTVVANTIFNFDETYMKR